MVVKPSRKQIHRIAPGAANRSLTLSESIRQEDWTQVLSICQRALSDTKREASDKAKIYELMGRAFAGQGEDAQAIAAYQKGIRLKFAQPESHYALGVLYSRREKHAQAICHYQIALNFRPNWPEAAFNLGRLFREVGNYEQAIETYRSILQHRPTYADARLALGRLHEYKGDFRQAARQYRQALLAQEDNSASRSDRSMAYRYLGSALVQLQQPEAAIQIYREAIALQPNDATLHNLFAQALIARGRTFKAFNAFQQALHLDPNSASAHHNIGRLWYNHQDLDKAIHHFQQAIQQAPDRPGVLSSCARTLSNQGKWRELFECFKLAIVQQPNFIAAYCQRAIQLSDEDLLFRLQKVCGRFLMGLRYADIDMAYPILCERLSQLYKGLGDLSIACDAPNQAITCYQRALALEPASLETYSRLADCLISQGRLAAGLAIAQAGLLESGTAQMVAEPASQPVTLEQVALEEVNISSVTVESADAEEVIAATASQLQLQAILQKGLMQPETNALPAERDRLQGAYRHAQDWLHKASASVSIADISPHTPHCGGVTCSTCMGNLINRFSPAQIGKQTFRCSPAPASDDLLLPTFAVTIPNGRAWIAPKQNAWAVCHEIAIFTPDNFLLADLSRSYPWFLPGCKHHDAVNHTIFQREEPLPPAQRLLGKVAILSGLSGHIYYHWLFDVLPRLNILKQYLQEQNLDLSDIDCFVVNNFEKGYQIETLTALGVPVEKVVASDRTPHIEADELVVPSFAGQFDWVPPATIDFLREHLLPKQPNRSLPKRIYVSREQASYRKIFNESDVVEALSHFNFTTVVLETMTVAQQAQLFSQAEIIVSPHGSGLANLTFCSPNTAVIECFSPHYRRTDYWMISQYLQLNHYYLVGEGFACDSLRQLMYASELTEDFFVDIAALRSLLTRLVQDPA